MAPLFAGYSYLIVYNTINVGKWVENASTDFWRYFVLTILHPVGYSAIICIIFLLITLSTVRISRILHEEMLKKTCNAPINLYFDKTPSGRILNRFSKDINKMDESIAHTIVWCLECYVCALFSVYIAIMNSPWVLLIIPLFLGATIWLLRYYMRTFKDLKRLESVTFSPIITHLTETLGGLTTIRAFLKNGDSFIKQNYAIVNTNLNVAFWITSVRRWFSIRLEIICVIVIIFTCGFLIYFRKTADPLLIGALFVHAVWLSIELLWGSQLLTALEGDLVAYSRCLKILEIPQESSQIVESFNSSNWPMRGDIHFTNYFLRYRPETEHKLLIKINVNKIIKNKYACCEKKE